MKVTSENYVQLATKTESPVTEEMKVRLSKSYNYLIDIFKKQVELGTELDILKKYIYYGKGSIPTDNRNCSSKELEKVTDDSFIRLLHGVVGVTTEATEMIEALSSYLLTEKELDLANISEENGDAYWYQAIINDVTNTEMNKVLQTNIEKLAARYPDKFSEQLAINRNLEVERTILEKGTN